MCNISHAGKGTLKSSGLKMSEKGALGINPWARLGNLTATNSYTLLLIAKISEIMFREGFVDKKQKLAIKTSNAASGWNQHHVMLNASPEICMAWICQGWMLHYMRYRRYFEPSAHLEVPWMVPGQTVLNNLLHLYVHRHAVLQKQKCLAATDWASCPSLKDAWGLSCPFFQ